MYDFTTELIKNLSNNVSVEEIFRVELEKAFNQLLETELDCFLGVRKVFQRRLQHRRFSKRLLQTYLPNQVRRTQSLYP